MASNKKDNSNETNDELELFEFKKDLLNLVHVAADASGEFHEEKFLDDMSELL